LTTYSARPEELIATKTGDVPAEAGAIACDSRPTPGSIA